MGYLEYYNLNDDPFRLTPDPEYFFPSESHELGIRSLDYCIDSREGFCVITGEPGTGKTTLLNVFIKQWKEKADIALILTPRLMPEDFLAAVLDDLGLELKARNKNELIKQFRDYLLERHQKGSNVIIIVDEAQNLPVETIEELRLLSNLETDREKLLQIVLVGQPELDSLLKTRALRQLNQRIVTKLSLKLLNEKETQEYINFRLFRAGKTTLRFDDAAVKQIHRLTAGNPRLINILAKRALMAAYLEESWVVSKRHVKKAEKSLGDTEELAHRRALLSPKGLVPLLFLILLVALLISFWSIREGDRIGVKRNKKDTPPLGQERVEKGIPDDTAASYTDTESNVMDSEKQRRAATSHAVVSVGRANVRVKPGLDYKTVAIVSKGQRYLVEDSRKDGAGRRWYLIRLSDQLKGWISERVVVID